MDTRLSNQGPEGPDAAPSGPFRPHPWIAWFVVLLVAGGSIALQSMDATAPIVDAEGEIETGNASHIQEPSDLAGLGDDAMVTIQGRPLLGMMTLVPSEFESEIDKLLVNRQPVQQIRGWILLGVNDPDAGIKGLRELASLDDKTVPVKVVTAALHAAEAMAGDPSFDEAHLQSELGWFGNLAWAIGGDSAELEAMQNSARNVVIVLAIGICVLALSALAGLVLGIIALVKINDGSLRSGLQPPDMLHGLYAETFAVWLVLFNVLSIAAVIIATEIGAAPFTVLLVFFPASLFALVWPSLRGSTLARTCADIGWTQGRGIVREIGAGIVGWMGMLPIQFIGIVCTLTLMAIAGVAEGDTDAPTHPIIDALGDPFAVFTAFMVAVVLAPIVEETVFRGLLYRQLRSVSRFRRGAISVLASASITGLLFAAIHPQGVLGIPALMSIAIAVAFAREWRGSLIAPMLMHAMNNAMAVTAMLIIIKW